MPQQSGDGEKTRTSGRLLGSGKVFRRRSRTEADCMTVSRTARELVKYGQWSDATVLRLLVSAETALLHYTD